MKRRKESLNKYINRTYLTKEEIEEDKETQRLIPIRYAEHLVDELQKKIKILAKDKNQQIAILSQIKILLK